MIIVADSSPLNHLVQIGHADILPAVFGSVVAPPAVINELRHAHTPAAVRAFVDNPPAWFTVRAPTIAEPQLKPKLGPGERAAITLSLELKADFLLLDDLDARRAAIRLGLTVTGTLGAIRFAGKKHLIDVPAAVASLRLTSQRWPRAAMQRLVDEFVDHQ